MAWRFGFAGAFFLCAGFAWLGSTTRAPAHVVAGTETLIHVAASGVEITFRTSLKDWQRLSGTKEQSPQSMQGEFATAWAVVGDGQPCTAVPLSVDEAPGVVDGHLRLRARFLCASLSTAVSIRPTLSFDEAGAGVHVVRMIIADRVAVGRFEGPDAKIDIPIATLLDRWNAVLAPEFVTPGVRARD